MVNKSHIFKLLILKNKLAKFVAYTIRDSEFYTYSQDIEIITDIKGNSIYTSKQILPAFGDVRIFETFVLFEDLQQNQHN